MTWELFADIVNAILLCCAFTMLGSIIYVYIDNRKANKHNDEINASDTGWVYANGKLQTTGKKNHYEKGTRQGAGLRDSKRGTHETKL